MKRWLIIGILMVATLYSFSQEKPVKKVEQKKTNSEQPIKKVPTAQQNKSQIKKTQIKKKQIQHTQVQRRKAAQISRKKKAVQRRRNH